MKKLFILLVMANLILSGCMGGGAQKMLAEQKKIMAQIPDHQFEKFEYRRTGMYSSANITAIGAEKVGGTLMVKDIKIDLHYGPENLFISVEGYGQDVPVPKGE